MGLIAHTPSSDLCIFRYICDMIYIAGWAGKRIWLSSLELILVHTEVLCIVWC